MNFFRAISPNHPPAHIDASGDLQVNRERILQALLLVVGLASVVAFGILAPQWIADRQFALVMVSSGVLVLVLAFVAYRRMPFILRSGIVLCLMFAATIFTFGLSGLQGNGRLFLLTFLSISTVLLGWKAGLAFLLVTHVSLFALGYGVLHRLILLPPFAGALTSASQSEWLNAGISMAILSAIMTFALSMLIYGLETSFQRARQLSRELAGERAGLQEKVDRQTEEIQDRMRQVTVASEISRTIVALRDPDLLLPRICQLVKERFGLYYVGVFLTDDHNQAVLQAGTGEAGQKMIAAGHSLPVGGTSMIGWAIANRQSRVALDVGSEPIRFNNPELPETRSELALPIISRDECLGALSIQSERPDAFDDNEIHILQGIADSLAIALENARLIIQTQASLDEVRALNRGYLQQAWAEWINEYGHLSYTYENPEPQSSPGGNVIQIPLTLREQVIGQINLETDATSLTPDQLEYIDVINTQTTLALENARLLQETQRQANQEQTLNDLTVDFSQAINIDDILKSALHQLSQLPLVSDVTVQVMPLSKPVEMNGVDGSEPKLNGNGKG